MYLKKNDDGNNWRSSEHPSDFLWNGSSSDFGSPLSSHFITPSISIEAYGTPEIDSTKNTICAFVSDSTICQPGSDGRPGGYAAIQLTGSAINVDNSSVTLDSLYWQIDSLYWQIDDTVNVMVQNTIVTNSPIWYPSRLHIDTSTQTIIYKVPLFTRDIDGFMGKTDATIYIEKVQWISIIHLIHVWI